MSVAQRVDRFCAAMAMPLRVAIRVGETNTRREIGVEHATDH
jgi:hypothetical protein